MKENGEDVNVTDSTCQCSPTTALEHHLTSNSTVPAHFPLFAFETGVFRAPALGYGQHIHIWMLRKEWLDYVENKKIGL